MTVGTEITLEPSAHVEGVAESCSIEGSCRSFGSNAGSAQEENGLIAMEPVRCVGEEVGVGLAAWEHGPLDETG